MTPEQKRQNRKYAHCEVVDVKQDIPDVVQRFCVDRLHQTDPAKITQGQFNAVLLNIQDTVIIPHVDMLCLDNPTRYRDDILEDLYNIYTRLCMEFDKHTCIFGFSCMTGISRDIIYTWLDGSGVGVTQTRQDIAKTLQEYDEQSLQDLLITGKRNPVGIVAVLNNKHGWSSQNIRHETTVRTSDNSAIAQALGIPIEQKDGKP